MSTTDYSAIRLDRSRASQTVHGTRVQGDPHYNVHFFQGGLPFDAQGNLVPPDNKSAPWQGRDGDGALVTFHPLYTEQMLRILEVKMKRAAGIKSKEPDPAEDTEADDDDDKIDLSEEVNLDAWLRGAVKYEPQLIYAACKKRFGRHYTRLREVVEELVYDTKLVPEEEVASDILKLLN